MRLRNVSRFKVGNPGEVTVYPQTDRNLIVQMGKTKFELQSDSEVTLRQVYNAETARGTN